MFCTSITQDTGLPSTTVTSLRSMIRSWTTSVVPASRLNTCSNSSGCRNVGRSFCFWTHDFAQYFIGSFSHSSKSVSKKPVMAGESLWGFGNFPSFTHLQRVGWLKLNLLQTSLGLVYRDLIVDMVTFLKVHEISCW